ncbi:MAG TPA: glycosyltransferase family 39 protein [Terriglobales bacterium]
MDSEIPASDQLDARNPSRAPRSARAGDFMIPAVFLLLYLSQCIWFLRTQSLTYDEPVHIVEGLDAWRHGRFEQYNDHPPLARLWCTLPLISDKWEINLQPLDDGFTVASMAPDPESLAWRGRIMNVLLGLALGFLVWLAAKRLFSSAAANFALALYAFSPALIAHFSLVTTDGAAALFIFAAAWQLLLWKEDPTWRRALIFGLVLGLLLLAKYSTLPMFVLAVLWMLILRPDSHFNPLKWNWGKTAVACILALCLVWAGYFFHVSHLSVHDGTLTATFPNWQGPLVKPVHSPDYSILVPAGEFIQGFREVLRHNRHGQAAFFLGRVSATGGWKLYYPVTLLLKWPVIVLLLSLCGLVLGFRRKLPAALWIMLSFPALYFALAIFARFNLGERHILPLYPFALLLAAAVWESARRRRLLLLLSVLAGLNAADALRFAPGYLSYFTPVVRPSTSFHLLTDSNLDWGQGLIALRSYERRHPGEKLWLAYFGSVNPALYGIRATPLPEGQRVTGTVVVSATHLSGQFLSDPNAYHWLLRHSPAQVLDQSLFVYKVAPE